MQRLSAFEYRYLTEFQSHEPEFDYLKSLEIEEKINQVQRHSQTCATAAPMQSPLLCIVMLTPFKAAAS